MNFFFAIRKEVLRTTSVLRWQRPRCCHGRESSETEMYFSDRLLLVQVWEGLNVITVGRKILGATDPAKAEPGTIRGDFGIVTGR